MGYSEELKMKLNEFLLLRVKQLVFILYLF